jgi:hypothetical protein
VDPSDLMPSQEPNTVQRSAGNEAHVAAAQSREVAMVAAAFTAAQRYPRNRSAIIQEVLDVCSSAEFADKACYSFDMGDGKVEGPGIKLVREVAKLWGRVWHTVDVLVSDESRVKIRAQAMDLERMQMAAFEDEFAPLVERINWVTDANGKRRKDGTRMLRANERQRRELIGRRGSILLRRVLTEMIPFDVLKLAEKKCKEIAAATEKKLTPREYATWLLGQFKELGIVAERVEFRLGKSIFDASRDELLELNDVRKRVVNDAADADEEFPYPDSNGGAKADASGGALDNLRKKAEAATGQPAATVTGDASPTAQTEAPDDGANGSAEQAKPQATAPSGAVPVANVRTAADVARTTGVAPSTPKEPTVVPAESAPALNEKARAALCTFIRNAMRDQVENVAATVDAALLAHGANRIDGLPDVALAKLHGIVKEAVQAERFKR